MRVNLWFLMYCLLSVVICGAGPVDGHCEIPAPSQSEEFPQEGVLAVAGSIPASGSLSLPLPLGLAAGKTPPVTGGLSQKDGTKWSYQLTNNFPQRVSLNLEIRQYDAARKNITSTRISHRLKTGESAQEDFTTKKETAGCALVLTSWKFVK